MRNIQRIRSLATTPMTFTAANTYIGQVGELVSVFDDSDGTAVALRIHDGNTVGGLLYYQINSYVPSSDPNAPNQDGVDNTYTGISSGWLTESVIDYSAYFDGTNYLSKNFGSGGDSTTWTWSCWIKRSEIDEYFTTIQAAHPNPASTWFATTITNSNKLEFSATAGQLPSWESSGLFIDMNTWYHIVCVADTKNSTMNGLYSTDRVRMYVNGQQIWISGGQDPGVGNGTIMNTAVTHTIGGYEVNKANGYMANLQFIDGAALDASYFGETVEGNWIHRPYDGTSTVEGATPVSGLSGNDIYGTNGFYLNFADESNLGKDVSGNNKHFNVLPA